MSAYNLTGQPSHPYSQPQPALYSHDNHHFRNDSSTYPAREISFQQAMQWQHEPRLPSSQPTLYSHYPPPATMDTGSPYQTYQQHQNFSRQRLTSLQEPPIPLREEFLARQSRPGFASSLNALPSNSRDTGQPSIRSALPRLSSSQGNLLDEFIPPERKLPFPPPNKKPDKSRIETPKKKQPEMNKKNSSALRDKAEGKKASVYIPLPTGRKRKRSSSLISEPDVLTGTGKIRLAERSYKYKSIDSQASRSVGGPSQARESDQPHPPVDVVSPSKASTCSTSSYFSAVGHVPEAEENPPKPILMIDGKLAREKDISDIVDAHLQKWQEGMFETMNAEILISKAARDEDFYQVLKRILE